MQEQYLDSNSLLFDVVAGEVAERNEEPECFRDLNLNQLVASVARDRPPPVATFVATF